MKAAEAYPLTWPKGVPRTQSADRKNASFGSATGTGRKALTMQEARTRMQRELDALTPCGHNWRVTGVVLSTNVELRLDGLPRSGQRPDDPGACLYFHLDGRPHSMPCDKWLRVEDNVAAIAKHIEAIRGMERWGVADVAQMFAGFAELPAPAPLENWWDVFHVDRNAPAAVVDAAYRELSKHAHPDVAGGSDEAMARLNQARDSYRSERSLA